MFHRLSTVGLAIASDLGIGANCLAMALLLHQRKLVSFFQLQWREIGKAGLTAVAAGLLSYQIVRSLMVNNSRLADIKALGLGGVTWAAAVAAGLWLTRSTLLTDLRRRKAPAAQPPVQPVSEGAQP